MRRPPPGCVLRDEAPAAFKTFRHFSNTSFFEVYPVDLDPSVFMMAHFDDIQGKLATAGTSQLERFLANYPKDMLGSSYDRLSGLYFEALSRQTPNQDGQSLRIVLANLNHAAKRGFSASSASSLKIGFVEVTSKTLLREKQIDFPAEIEVDMPVETVALKLDKALSDGAENPDYIIIFDVALAKASRWVQNIEKIHSTYLAGYEEKPNPDYDIAKMKVMEAQNQRTATEMQNSMNTSPSTTPAAAIFKGLAKILGVIAANAGVNKSMEELKETPQFIKTPVYNKYTFDKAHMEAKKVMTVNYYVIDRRAGSYFKSTFDITDDRVFSVIYNVHQDDPDHDTNEASGNTEKDVTEWEDAPLDVKLSLLVDNYLANQGKTRKLPKLVKLREELLADKNRALANYDANSYGFTTGNDPRFDSVVVVYNPDGGLGTGFYVRPDVVLTNWHVVEGSKFVEMELFDDQETFGKVINTDVRLDLALVKVQNRGKPVTFYEKKSLPLGTSLDAIGHPNRHEFSITRGVLSSVRKVANINIPGGDKVLYIQTDTPISKGNSGGPLFFKNQVVGVNTFKSNVTDGYENLNFSVHYSEVKNFIKESLGGSFEEETEELREPME
ncbi:MAG: trypsin-like peptidase domain-containing protein [Alphaproteobacteria bacterium]|nr:trypsin-like peptidase domain-containing protein [Alphaproteobacteria bacterium]